MSDTREITICGECPCCKYTGVLFRCYASGELSTRPVRALNPEREPPSWCPRGENYVFYEGYVKKFEVKNSENFKVTFDQEAYIDGNADE